jgi:surface antigen
MRRGELIAVVLMPLALASCAGSETPLALQQPASPASTVTGSVPNPLRTVANAGVLGNGIGTGLDERDRQRAFAAEMQALDQGEPGEPVGWKGHPGRYGTVVPGAFYETRGTRCRDYSHTIYVDGRPQTARATACRGPDGAWTPVT